MVSVPTAQPKPGPAASAQPPAVPLPRGDGSLLLLALVFPIALLN
jgi:hypothetical protein